MREPRPTGEGQITIRNRWIITQSTNPHVDIFLESGQHVTDEDRVAFVFLNDNPGARFRHGEVEIAIDPRRRR